MSNKIELDALPCRNKYIYQLCIAYIIAYVLALISELAVLSSENYSSSFFDGIATLLSGFLGAVFFYYAAIGIKAYSVALCVELIIFSLIELSSGLIGGLTLFYGESEEMERAELLVLCFNFIFCYIIGCVLKYKFEGKLKGIGRGFIYVPSILLIGVIKTLKYLVSSHGSSSNEWILMLVFIISGFVFIFMVIHPFGELLRDGVSITESHVVQLSAPVNYSGAAIKEAANQVPRREVRTGGIDGRHKLLLGVIIFLIIAIIGLIILVIVDKKKSAPEVVEMIEEVSEDEENPSDEFSDDEYYGEEGYSDDVIEYEDFSEPEAAVEAEPAKEAQPETHYSTSASSSDFLWVMQDLMRDEGLNYLDDDQVMAVKNLLGGKTFTAYQIDYRPQYLNNKYTIKFKINSINSDGSFRGKFAYEKILQKYGDGKDSWFEFKGNLLGNAYLGGEDRYFIAIASTNPAGGKPFDYWLLEYEGNDVWRGRSVSHNHRNDPVNHYYQVSLVTPGIKGHKLPRREID